MQHAPAWRLLKRALLMLRKLCKGWQPQLLPLASIAAVHVSWLCMTECSALVRASVHSELLSVSFCACVSTPVQSIKNILTSNRTAATSA